VGITPTTVDGSGATVQITVDGSAISPSFLSVSTDRASYLPGQTVAATVTDLAGTSPAVGASIAVTVTSPNGRSTTLTGITGSNGTAVLNYKLSKRATLGNYLVRASSGGSTTGSSSTSGASTNFTVQ